MFANVPKKKTAVKTLRNSLVGFFIKFMVCTLSNIELAVQGSLSHAPTKAIPKYIDFVKLTEGLEATSSQKT